MSAPQRSNNNQEVLVKRKRKLSGKAKVRKVEQRSTSAEMFESSKINDAFFGLSNMLGKMIFCTITGSPVR